MDNKNKLIGGLNTCEQKYIMLNMQELKDIQSLSEDTLSCRIYSFIADIFLENNRKYDIVVVSKQFLCRYFNTSVSSVYKAIKILNQKCKTFEIKKIKNMLWFTKYNINPERAMKNKVKFRKYSVKFIQEEKECTI